MAKLVRFAIAFFFVIELAFAVELPVSSPAPTPELGISSPPELAPAPEAGSPALAPANSPMAASPPAPIAPSPSDLLSPPAPENSPVSSPAPAPTVADSINHSNVNGDGEQPASGSGGGMSGGKKAGIAVAVIIAACLVGLGGLVYKKRQENIRRTQYGYAARREML